jgi:hypothetical protein
VDSSRYFKVREVANWLIDVVPLRSKTNDILHGPKSRIIGNIEKTLRKYFKELNESQLLKSKEADISTKTGKTLEYKLTDFGNLIALIINLEYDVSTSKYDRLYQYLLSYFTHESYSLDEFCIRYLHKIKESNLFESFATNIKKNSIYYNELIRNDHDLFTFMILLRTGNKQTDEALWKLWEESLSELDPDHMKLLFHNLKLKIEKMLEMNAKDYSEYERIRYLIRDRIGHIPVGIYCAKCNDDTKCSYHTIPLKSYLASLFYDSEILTDFVPTNTKCKTCGESEFNYNKI